MRKELLLLAAASLLIVLWSDGALAQFRGHQFGTTSIEDALKVEAGKELSCKPLESFAQVPKAKAYMCTGTGARLFGMSVTVLIVGLNGKVHAGGYFFLDGEPTLGTGTALLLMETLVEKYGEPTPAEWKSDTMAEWKEDWGTLMALTTEMTVSVFYASEQYAEEMEKAGKEKRKKETEDL